MPSNVLVHSLFQALLSPHLPSLQLHLSDAIPTKFVRVNGAKIRASEFCVKVEPVASCLLVNHKQIVENLERKAFQLAVILTRAIDDKQSALTPSFLLFAFAANLL